MTVRMRVNERGGTYEEAMVNWCEKKSNRQSGVLSLCEREDL